MFPNENDDANMMSKGEPARVKHVRRKKNVMTKNPISVDKNMLAAKSLSIMSDKKITSLCVYKDKKKHKTIGILHIHNILDARIN